MNETSTQVSSNTTIQDITQETKDCKIYLIKEEPKASPKDHPNFANTPEGIAVIIFMVLMFVLRI
jgi:hypothetical protein